MLSVSEVDLESIAVAGVSREYLLHHRICPDKLDGDGALIVAVGPGAFLEAIPELSDIYRRPVVARRSHAESKLTGRFVRHSAERGTSLAEGASIGKNHIEQVLTSLGNRESWPRTGSDEGRRREH